MDSIRKISNGALAQLFIALIMMSGSCQGARRFGIGTFFSAGGGGIMAPEPASSELDDQQALNEDNNYGFKSVVDSVMAPEPASSSPEPSDVGQAMYKVKEKSKPVFKSLYDSVMAPEPASSGPSEVGQALDTIKEKSKSFVDSVMAPAPEPASSESDFGQAVDKVKEKTKPVFKSLYDTVMVPRPALDFDFGKLLHSDDDESNQQPMYNDELSPMKAEPVDD